MNRNMSRDSIESTCNVGMNELGQYLEKVLGELHGSYDREIEEIEATESWDPDDVESPKELIFLQHREIFLPILFDSFIVVTYSQLEYLTKQVVALLRQETGHPVGLSKFKGDLLERVELFLQSSGLRTVDTALTMPLVRLTLVRNCIVHNAGLLPGSQNEASLRAALASANLAINDAKRIHVTPSYCRDLLPQASAFLAALLRARC